MHAWYDESGIVAACVLWLPDVPYRTRGRHVEFGCLPLLEAEKSRFFGVGFGRLRFVIASTVILFSVVFGYSCPFF